MSSLSREVQTKNCVSNLRYYSHIYNNILQCFESVYIKEHTSIINFSIIYGSYYNPHLQMRELSMRKVNDSLNYW
jgi:hypothetical protein